MGRSVGFAHLSCCVWTDWRIEKARTSSFILRSVARSPRRVSALAGPAAGGVDVVGAGGAGGAAAAAGGMDDAGTAGHDPGTASRARLRRRRTVRPTRIFAVWGRRAIAHARPPAERRRPRKKERLVRRRGGRTPRAAARVAHALEGLLSIGTDDSSEAADSSSSSLSSKTSRLLVRHVNLNGPWHDEWSVDVDEEAAPWCCGCCCCEGAAASMVVVVVVVRVGRSFVLREAVATRGGKRSKMGGGAFRRGGYYI